MIIKCNNGWEFDTNCNEFSTGEENVFYVSLSVQDVADMLSIAHAEKVKKDNEIKKQYANNTSTSN